MAQSWHDPGTTKYCQCHDHTMTIQWPWHKEGHDHNAMEIIVILWWCHSNIVMIMKWPWRDQVVTKIKLTKTRQSNAHGWSQMTIYDNHITNDKCPRPRPYHDDSTMMTRPWHNQALTKAWSHGDHTMTMTQEGHGNNTKVISWSFYGNAIVMLLSHQMCHIHLIVLSWQYHGYPISIHGYIYVVMS